MTSFHADTAERAQDIFLINDTSAFEDNPGCHITVDQMIGLLMRRHSSTGVRRVPYGYKYEVFRKALPSNKTGIRQFFHKIRSQENPRINWAVWRGCVDSCFADDTIMENAVNNNSSVYINGEGSIHHDHIGTVALLGMAKSLLDKKLSLQLVNATVQDINGRFIDAVLGRLSSIAAREPYTFRYLSSLGLRNVRQAADCAFLWTETPAGMKGGVDGDTCLYTPGVLAIQNETSARLCIERMRHDLTALSSEGFDVTLLQVDKREGRVMEEFAGSYKQILLEDYEPSGILALLSDFKLVVSGRYHILIFAAMAGRTVIGLPSNTWKIQGLFELLEIPLSRIAASHDGLQLALKQGLKPVSGDLIQKCRELAENNVPVLG